jgi:hypothetical protein
MDPSATLGGARTPPPMANLTEVVRTTFESNPEQLNQVLGYNTSPVGPRAKQINRIAQEIFTSIRSSNDPTISEAMNTILSGDYEVTFHENGALDLIGSTNISLTINVNGHISINDQGLGSVDMQEIDQSAQEKIRSIYNIVHGANQAYDSNSDDDADSCLNRGACRSLHSSNLGGVGHNALYTRTHHTALSPSAAQASQLSQLQSDLEGKERMIEELKGALSANQQRIQTPQMQDEQLEANGQHVLSIRELEAVIAEMDRELLELTKDNAQLRNLILTLHNQLNK